MALRPHCWQKRQWRIRSSAADCCWVLHLEMTTRQVREWGLESDSKVFLQFDPKGIHIMPVRGEAKLRADSTNTSS